jgi:hypothetical protein
LPAGQLFCKQKVNQKRTLDSYRIPVMGIPLCYIVSMFMLGLNLKVSECW